MFSAINQSACVLDIICILLFHRLHGEICANWSSYLACRCDGRPNPSLGPYTRCNHGDSRVFLVARCSPMFEYSNIALTLVTIVGALTCIFAATIALVQTDIKKIIAYSTCSQLGYMFFACGVSAYSAAIFHLATHAFFKALLFLGAGSCDSCSAR